MRTGTARLPLHGGRAPRWLFERMVRLAREIVLHMAAEHEPAELLRRLSDPWWFQALGCVLGFDWHSSGVTTTTCGALKEGIKGLEGELGLFVCGGKGAASRRTPGEIEQWCEQTGLDADALVRSSRLSAKVDNTAVQDSYQLYHHSFLFLADGRWAVIQQGMRDVDGTARRYHWLGEGVESFVEEPHAAVCCDRRAPALNLVASDSAAARDCITGLAVDAQRETLKLVERLPELRLPNRHPVRPEDINPRYLKKVLLKTWEQPPEDFAALLGVPGLGPKSLRALALVAELIYGTPASTRDPARFSFAHGGKDGTPYPVDRQTYEQTIVVLHDAVRRAGVPDRERVAALRRLGRFLPA
ncbi:MAG: DUF763 domain-containing protein [Gammaproteobacteria bacterium]|nr:MAG: DUF763 domain-containing protein [Gammaproteobacteria bacterium]